MGHLYSRCLFNPSINYYIGYDVKLRIIIITITIVIDIYIFFRYIEHVAFEFIFRVSAYTASNNNNNKTAEHLKRASRGIYIFICRLYYIKSSIAATTGWEKHNVILIILPGWLGPLSSCPFSMYSALYYIYCALQCSI